MSDQGVSLAEGSIDFVKGKSYLIAYSAKEQGSVNAGDIKSIEKQAHLYGFKVIALNIDSKRDNVSWGDFVKTKVGSASFDGVFFSQHGTLAGAKNSTVTGQFRNDLAPLLGSHLNAGGYVVLMQCRGVFSNGFVSSIKASFGGAPVYSAGGYNSLNNNGAVSYLPVNPSTNEGRFYGNSYSPWK